MNPSRIWATTLGALACLMAASGPSSAQTWSPQKLAAAQSMIAQLQAQTHAASILVTLNGMAVYEVSFGVTQSGQLINVHTPFKIGSVSKQFTAAGILALQEDQTPTPVPGRIFNIDEDMADFFTGTDAWSAGAPLTVRELLNMDSGLPSYTCSIPPSDPPHCPQPFFLGLDPTRPVPARIMLERIKMLPRGPGGFNYSNTNLFLAAEIIEGETASAGHRGDYRTYLQNRIFSPAGMTETGFASTTADSALAQPWFKCPGAALAQPCPRAFDSGDWPKGAGEMVSTASDLTHWDLALFSRKVLNATSLQIMLQPAVPAPEFDGDYAMGWVVRQVGQTVEYQHSGDIPGYNAENLVMQDGAGRLATVVVLTAADGVGPLPLLARNLANLALHP